MALLHILTQIHPCQGCIAVYVDHGLRPHETESEIAAVKEAAGQLGTYFHQETIAVLKYAAVNGCSLEEAARVLRYQALEMCRIRHKAACIAVAHTADDQVEEFFIRLCRGSGLQGLAGMNLRNGRIIRPLLHETKQSLLRYLADRHIPFCLDSSNQDHRFLRNRVRLDLLPHLEKHFNPSIRQTVLQTMDILRQEDELLALLADKALGQILQVETTTGPDNRTSRIEISSRCFAAEHPALQRRILDKICWRMGCRPGFRQIDQILSLILRGENAGQVHLQGGLRIRKMAGRVLFSYPSGRKRFRGSGQEQIAIAQTIPGPGLYSFPKIGRALSIQLARPADFSQFNDRPRLFLDAEKINFPLQLKSICPGQRFRPFGSKGSRKVNRYLNDRKIPAHERPSVPALLAGERIIALPGIEIDNDFRLTAASRRVLVIEWQAIPPGDQTAGAKL